MLYLRVAHSPPCRVALQSPHLPYLLPQAESTVQDQGLRALPGSSHKAPLTSSANIIFSRPRIL